MKKLRILLLSIIVGCGHLAKKSHEGPVLISQKKSRSYERVNVREHEGTYPLTKDITPALLRFIEDAATLKAKYLSHLTLTTYEGSRSCVIIVGTEEDLNSLNSRDVPSDGPRRLELDAIAAQEKIYESKAFCKIALTGAQRDFVLIQARIYTPDEDLKPTKTLD